MFYLYTKFGEPRFGRSGDMIAGIEAENGSRDPDQALFKGDLSSMYWKVTGNSTIRESAYEFLF